MFDLQIENDLSNMLLDFVQFAGEEGGDFSIIEKIDYFLVIKKMRIFCKKK